MKVLRKKANCLKDEKEEEHYIGSPRFMTIIGIRVSIIKQCGHNACHHLRGGSVHAAHKIVVSAEMRHALR